MLIGYARVSTQDQNLDLQCEALSKAGCKKVFEDKVSGTRANRISVSIPTLYRWVPASAHA
jgi:DNA invertase Pin-like site-specific DNA recombinase